MKTEKEIKEQLNVLIQKYEDKLEKGEYNFKTDIKYDLMGQNSSLFNNKKLEEYNNKKQVISQSFDELQLELLDIFRLEPNTEKYHKYYAIFTSYMKQNNNDIDDTFEFMSNLLINLNLIYNLLCCEYLLGDKDKNKLIKITVDEENQ